MPRRHANPDACRTPRQIARYLGVGATRVLGWIRSGDLRALNIGDALHPRYRISPQALADFERARQIAAQPAPRKRAKKAKPPPGWTDFYADEKWDQAG